MNSCAACDQPIREDAVAALNALFHPDHFVCHSCKRPIRQTYQHTDNHAFCVPCYAAKFNPKCSGCGQTLVESCLLALGRHWHPNCFVCTRCRGTLPNGEFYNPYDLNCHFAERYERQKTSKP